MISRKAHSMKARTHDISAAEFVVRLPKGLSPDSLAGKLRGFGTLESIAGQAGLHILRLAKAAPSPKEGWEMVCKKLGDKVEVSPVFFDEDKAPRYAAGTLQVRFPSPLGDAELHKWLPQGLRVKSRNEYMPAQVRWNPRILPASTCPTCSRRWKRKAIKM